MPSAAATSAPGGLETVRRFINTLDIEAGTDAIDSPATLRRWLMDAELVRGNARVSSVEVDQARHLRDALRTAVAANHDGAQLPADVVVVLNRAAEHAAL